MSSSPTFVASSPIGPEPGLASPLTRRQSREAALQGREARAVQARRQGRARPVDRDPGLVTKTVATRLVRRAVAVVDGDAEVMRLVHGRVKTCVDAGGRPRELPIRSALICFALLAMAGSNFHILNLPELVASMTWRTRRALGIDYLDRRGQPKQVSYQQLLRAFHAIAAAFDPLDPGITDEEAAERERDLRTLSFRLIQAGITTKTPAGSVAVDATLKWGWDRPTGTMRKLERRGKDGDAGSPLPLSDITDIYGTETFTRRPLHELRHSPRPRRRRPSTWGPGSAWVGRPNLAKSLYGIALHAVTATDRHCPPVIEAIAVTPAPALPSLAALPLLEQLRQMRTERGANKPLGSVVADPAYSANPRDWQQPIRQLAGSPIFRLHRTNQAGRRFFDGLTFVDGRPYCSCIPDDLAEIPFPRYPHRRATLEQFMSDVSKRQRWEMPANTGFRPDGSRQFRYPHWNPRTKTGGCYCCVNRDGTPVINETTGLAKLPCCTKATRVVDAEALGLYQDVAFGEPEWFERWNARDRVEGSFGSLKNLALTNWGRDYHHFVGLVRETLIATFAVIAHNQHIQRTWKAKQALLASQPIPRAPLKRQNRRPEPPAQGTPRGPKGLEFLGTPRRRGP